ncbi:hypothetical protein CDL15_Pgr018342 [Punica granatum]|uniref:Uncharacterized protein n=1 Tax=Punica granatum TaxID=22663 RepID=A0A218WI06_PUNGR|nr:hypothetical protein CDL15_Pgr018342 [Punica granatum]
MTSSCKLLSQSHSLFPLSAPNTSPVALKRTHCLFSSSINHSTLHGHHLNSAAAHTISRRLFLPSVSGIWDALTGGGNNAREAVLAIRRGMLLFRQDRFEEGAEQFRIDVAQNPNDTEESIWCFLCEAQLCGVDEARRRFLEVGRDPRPVMREAYNMFKDGGDPEKFAALFLNGSPGEYFSASLYAGLYYESERKPDEAKRWILDAYRSPYGERSDDYMASLAKVHCLCRDWISS